MYGRYLDDDGEYFEKDITGKVTGGAIFWLKKATAQKYPAAFVRMATMHTQTDKKRKLMVKCGTKTKKEKLACETAAKCFEAGIALFEGEIAGMDRIVASEKDGLEVAKKELASLKKSRGAFGFGAPLCEPTCAAIATKYAKDKVKHKAVGDRRNCAVTRLRPAPDNECADNCTKWWRRFVVNPTENGGAPCPKLEERGRCGIRKRTPFPLLPRICSR